MDREIQYENWNELYFVTAYNLTDNSHAIRRSNLATRLFDSTLIDKVIFNTSEGVEHRMQLETPAKVHYIPHSWAVIAGWIHLISSAISPIQYFEADN